MHRASLNHTYRLAWRDVENTFVTVAENAKGRGKSNRNEPVLGAIALIAASDLLARASGQLGTKTLSAGSYSLLGTSAISAGNTWCTLSNPTATWVIKFCAVPSVLGIDARTST